MASPKDLPQTYSLSKEDIRQLPGDIQESVMERWFRSRYEDPAAQTPHDSEDGWLWVASGPYDARDELEEEFGDSVPPEIIDKLIQELEQDCVEWALVEAGEQFGLDPDNARLFDSARSNKRTLDTLELACSTVEALLRVEVLQTHSRVLCRLLFANVLTIIETYLADTFLGLVVSDQALLERFVQTNPGFKKESVQLSDVFVKAALMGGVVRNYLLDLIWYKLDRVRSMYLDVLDIDISPHMGEIARAIPTRHDIVHRNGRDRQGNEIVILSTDVQDLLQHVQRLARFIDSSRSSVRPAPELPF